MLYSRRAPIPARRSASLNRGSSCAENCSSVQPWFMQPCWSTISTRLPGTAVAKIPSVTASGWLNRLFWPDPVRHASVTTAMQGRTATQDDPQ